MSPAISCFILGYVKGVQGETGLQQPLSAAEAATINEGGHAWADAIDAAVFDLKAVNPNATLVMDDRTPEEVMRSIEGQAKIVAEALATLRVLLAN